MQQKKQVVALWALDPGYLGPAELQWMLHELSLRNRASGAGPELGFWLAQIEAEALLRSEPVSEASGDQLVPPVGAGRQLIALVASAGNGHGRIPLPTSAHQLWAQHKYSVMARDPALAKELGRAVSRLRAGPPPDALVGRLCAILRRPAPPGRARNALAHMWGYVSEAAEDEKEAMGQLLREAPAKALGRIAELASREGESYLLESTALGELRASLVGR